METKFPEKETIQIKIDENKSFASQIYIRYPKWLKRSPKVSINKQVVNIDAKVGEYIRLAHDWKAGDIIDIQLPMDLRLESTNDDSYLNTIFYGPLVMAGELGKEKMPGSDLVRAALDYKNWITETSDIPIFIADKVNLKNWIKQDKQNLLKFTTVKAGILNGKVMDISLIPYYLMHHQRYSVYWKIYSHNEFDYRKIVVQDEVNPSSETDEKAHNLQGENMKTSAVKDDRHFWENNLIGRFAEDGGWFSYDLKVNPKFDRNYLVVRYWGGASKNQMVDVFVNGTKLKTENLYNRMPLTYYEEVYELTDEIINQKDNLTVQFKAPSGFKTGHVFGAQVTSDPKAFPNFGFY
jgi:hypothetical protein